MNHELSQIERAARLIWTEAETARNSLSAADFRLSLRHMGNRIQQLIDAYQSLVGLDPSAANRSPSSMADTKGLSSQDSAPYVDKIPALASRWMKGKRGNRRN